MRVVVELRRDAVPRVVLNKLYKHTAVQTTFGVNAIALVDGVPRTLGLRDLVRHYLDHQREVVTRRSRYRLERAEARAHILEGLLVALENLDAVIALIRGAVDPDEARAGLMTGFDLTEVQARAILDLRLQRLTQLEAGKIQAEYAELQERIAELRAILGDEARVYGNHPRGAARDPRALRRRAPHRDHPRRGRHRPRGPDRRGGDGHLHLPRPATSSGSPSRPTAPRAAAARGCAG